MLRISLLATSLIFGFSVHAGSVDVKDVDTSEDTTIEIHKGKKKSDDGDKPVAKNSDDRPRVSTRIESDEVDIQGDPAPLASEARANWKKACDGWRKEFKEQHGKNVINASCGTATCSGDVGNKSCVSKAVYKIHVRDE